MVERTALLSGLFLLGLALPVAAEDPVEHAADWDYSEGQGPEAWADLDPAYVLARVGGSQSPIDLVPGSAIAADLPELKLSFDPQPLHILNNGHTVEAICPGAATLDFLGRDYSLRQFHFHAPSEHTVDGRHAEVEIHFVFADGEGHLVVIAVLFVEGEAEHPEIGQLLAREAVTEPGREFIDEATRVDPRSYLPDSLDYYTYDGSLTTPPATEGVRWFVLKKIQHLTRSQIEAIDRVYYSNNRPTQPLNARLVLTRR